MHNFSDYQKEIFQFPQADKQHGIVQAGPGCGKTSTAVEACKYITDRTLFLAFSAKIASHLQTKVPKHVEARTFNAYGWRILLSFYKGATLDANKTFNLLKGYVDIDNDKELFFSIQGPLKRIISILKNMNQSTTDAWKECAAACGMELPDLKAEQKEAFDNILPRLYEESITSTSSFDFDDQVFQPIFRDIPIPKSPYVIVDEAQDLNAVNIDMLHRLSNKGSRILMIGDEYQAIFSFRGAFSDSMDILRNTFQPKDYQLPICYRCPNAVIKMAQRINPNLQSPDPNPNGEGFTEHINLEKFRQTMEPGHFVISRTTLPLVTEVLRLNVKGVLAYVEGKEVKETLFKLIDKIWYNRMDMKYDLGQLVQDYKSGAVFDINDMNRFTDEMAQDLKEQIPRLQRQGKEDIIDGLQETVDTIAAIAETCDHVPALIKKIEDIFKDANEVNRPAVRAMTCHKVKGLENPVVHLLYPEDIPHYRAVKSGSESQLKQERNLRFVSDTRAQSGTFYVNKPVKQ